MAKFIPAINCTTWVGINAPIRGRSNISWSWLSPLNVLWIEDWLLIKEATLR